jgi:tetratricopeptide (TPR) repeat protein
MTSPRIRTLLSTICVLSALCAAEGPAWAEDAFNQHVSQARAAFKGGRFSEAIEELLQAYGLDPQPRLLLNLGHAYAGWQRPEEALRYYHRYQDAVPSLSDAERADLQRYISQAEAALERQRQPPPEEARPQADPPPPPPQQPVVTVAAPPPPPARKPLVRRWWFWTAIGAAVAAGTVGVTLAVTQPWATPSSPERLPPEIRSLDGKFLLVGAY